jgi:hypothetical protein
MFSGDETIQKEKWCGHNKQDPAQKVV